jgi:hypothetical protein
MGHGGVERTRFTSDERQKMQERLRRPLRQVLAKPLCGAVVLAAATISTVASFATAPMASAATCPPPPDVVQPFLPWGDAISYVPVTNGSFEPLAKDSKETPWTLSGNARLVSDNEPYFVSGSSGDKTALYLGAGGSAVSSCTTAPQISPVVRFFVKNVGDPTGQLHVEVLVNGGNAGVLDGGTITATPEWGPSPTIRLPWGPLRGAGDLRVRLTPIGAGATFEVDDVYIDPSRSR